MKLEVRSLRVPWSRKRDRLRFFGKKTILNVHETGLTVEGLVPEVWYPILMQFIYRVLCDWSIRSIPFSRIRSCIVRSRAKVRWGICMLWTACLAYMIFGIEPLLYSTLLALNFVATYLLVRLVFKDYVHLEYETKGLRRCAIRIRFRKSRDQILLFQEFSRHQLDGTAPVLAKVAKDVTQRRRPSFFGIRGGKA